MVFPVESEDRTLRNLLMLCQDHARLVVEVYRKVLVMIDGLLNEKYELMREWLDEIEKLTHESLEIKRNLMKELHETGALLFNREDLYRLISKASEVVDIIEGMGVRLWAIGNMKWKILCLCLIALFCAVCTAEAQVTGTFTYTVNGCIVTATPTLSAHVDYYKWKVENDIECETAWISSDDIEPHIFTLNYGVNYLITLYVMNETLHGESHASVFVPTQPISLEAEIEVTPDTTSEYKNMFDSFPEPIKEWFAERNQAEITIISICVVTFAFLFVVVLSHLL